MGRQIRSDAVHHGRNSDGGAYKDDRYVRCSRCNFICHLDRDQRAPEGSRLGWGISYEDQKDIEYVDTTSWTFISGGNVELVNTRGVVDPVVKAGCPQCGTYLYNKRR